MAFPPDCYIIGAPKSGTTTLAYLLNKHPSVCVSNPKETHYFSDNNNMNISWYKSKFELIKEDVINIDASTSYSMIPISDKNKQINDRINVPQRIYKMRPSAKFIYIVRNPIERTYSGYWHNVRMGRENRDFKEIVAKDSIYKDFSIYYKQIEQWLNYFSFNSFHVIIFEEFIKNPEKVVSGCLKFLDLHDDEIYINERTVLNKSYQGSEFGKVINRLNNYMEHKKMFYYIKKLYNFYSPKFLKRKINNLVKGNNEIPKIRHIDRLHLYNYFEGHNKNLENMLNVDLSYWN